MSPEGRPAASVSEGTFECPICLQATPHGHSADEIAFYPRGARKAFEARYAEWHQQFYDRQSEGTRWAVFPPLKLVERSGLFYVLHNGTIKGAMNLNAAWSFWLDAWKAGVKP